MRLLLITLTTILAITALHAEQKVIQLKADLAITFTKEDCKDLMSINLIEEGGREALRAMADLGRATVIARGSKFNLIDVDDNDICTLRWHGKTCYTWVDMLANSDANY